MNKTHLAFLTFELTATGKLIQLLPDGNFRASDGRPWDLPHWVMNSAVANLLVTTAAARKNPFFIDYEHQTYEASGNGQPAPAAGWFTGLEYQPGVGLFGSNVEWTTKAAAFIAAKEYRYISAVFRYDYKTGNVLEILNAALTNNPAIDGMNAVLATLSKRLETNPNPQPTLTGDPTVTPEQLALLGLAVGASDADVTATLAALKSQATQAEQIEPLKTEIAALKAGSPSAPEGFVPMAGYLELQSEVAALKASTAANDNAKLVDDALKDGRLMPSMKDWALALATSNKPQLEAFLQKAAPIAALNKQQSSTVSLPKVGIAQLSAEDKKHAETLGFSPEQYLQFKEQN